MRLTDEVLNTQPGHNPDWEHDFLERMALVSVELRLPVRWG